MKKLDWQEVFIMASQGNARKVLTNLQRGIKRQIYLKRVHETIPDDNRFVSFGTDAHVDVSGKVCILNEKHVYRADCGCYIETLNGMSGRCREGLRVCSRHYKWCPRQTGQPYSGSRLSPPLSACKRWCWWMIVLKRFAWWLVTPPRRRKVKADAEEE